jgi:hypothetical protein
LLERILKVEKTWKFNILINQEKKLTVCPLPWERGKPTRRSILTIGVRSHVETALCVYNSETTPPNNLESRAEENMVCSRIQMVV